MNPLLQARSLETETVRAPEQRILVVDDDACIRNRSVATLLSFGYQVDTAEDGDLGCEPLQIPGAGWTAVPAAPMLGLC